MLLQRQRGFSLLEVLLVMVLIAGATATWGAMLARQDTRRALPQTAAHLAADLRYARARALASQTPQRVLLDVPQHRWAAADRPKFVIPSTLHLEFFGGRELTPESGTGAIAFFPDGSSSGGRIVLYQGDARRILTVRWVTSDVEVSE